MVQYEGHLKEVKVKCQTVIRYNQYISENCFDLLTLLHKSSQYQTVTPLKHKYKLPE